MALPTPSSFTTKTTTTRAIIPTSKTAYCILLLTMTVTLSCQRAAVLALSPAMSTAGASVSRSTTSRLFLQGMTARQWQHHYYHSIRSPTAAFLSVRGGNSNLNSFHAPSSSSQTPAPPPATSITTRSHATTHTALAQASVTDNEQSSSSSSSSSSAATSEKDDPKDNKQHLMERYKQALAIDLPLLDFGGLSYWKTNAETISSASSKAPKFRVLFILGGPGAGKGTQSALMAENYPVVHLSVGQLLRDAQNDESSPHRALIQEALVAGKIVPVAISLALLQKAMQEASDKFGRDILFLVDGFPRNDDNLSGWCEYMGDVSSVWTTLFYQCPLNVLEERILERAQTSGRSDDNLESVHKRFHTFQEQTLPIIRKLETISTVLEIAGNQSLENVWLETQQALNQLIRHDVLTANADLLTAIEQGDVDTYQRLCDDLWFQRASSSTSDDDDIDTKENEDNDEDSSDTMVSLDPKMVMEKQEGKPQPIGTIDNAEVEFVSGKHVAVSYTRTMEGEQVREKRVWVYGGLDGWRNVHFSRTPVLPY